MNRRYATRRVATEWGNATGAYEPTSTAGSE
jgi:hypothetical protein